MENFEQELMEEHRHHPVEYWFNLGGSKHSYQKDAMKGVFTPEMNVSVLLGMACQAVYNYIQNKEKHFQTIDFFFFFTEKRQIEEAKQFNYLGLADELLFNTSVFFEKTFLNTQNKYLSDLMRTMNDIDQPITNSHYNVRLVLNSTKKNLTQLEKEIFLAYTKESTVDVTSPRANNSRLVNYFAKSGLKKIKRISEGIIDGQQRFPYASEFLSKHIFKYEEGVYLKKEVVETIEEVPVIAQ